MRGDIRMDRRAVTVRVLGPLDVSVDGRSVPLGGRRTQVIVAALALQGNRVASVEHLVDAVWDEAPPSTARGQVQFCISTLRRSLAGVGAGHVIETHPSGYLLRVRHGELDADRFAELAGSARHLADHDEPAA